MYFCLGQAGDFFLPLRVIAYRRIHCSYVALRSSLVLEHSPGVQIEDGWALCATSSLIVLQGNGFHLHMNVYFERSSSTLWQVALCSLTTLARRRRFFVFYHG